MDYSVKADSAHPCPEAAISFKKGDILEFLVCDDVNFIQARFVVHGSLCEDNDVSDKRNKKMTNSGEMLDLHFSIWYRK